MVVYIRDFLTDPWSPCPSQVYKFDITSEISVVILAILHRQGLIELKLMAFFDSFYLLCLHQPHRPNFLIAQFTKMANKATGTISPNHLIIDIPNLG